MRVHPAHSCCYEECNQNQNSFVIGRIFSHKWELARLGDAPPSCKNYCEACFLKPDVVPRSERENYVELGRTDLTVHVNWNESQNLDANNKFGIDLVLEFPKCPCCNQSDMVFRPTKIGRESVDEICTHSVIRGFLQPWQCRRCNDLLYLDGKIPITTPRRADLSRNGFTF